MAFKADCRQELTTELVTDDIEVSHSNIIGSLMEVASRHIPRSTPPRGKTRSVPYWTEECTRHVRERNEARKRLQRTRSLVDAEEYRRLKGVTLGSIFRASAVTVVILWSSRSANPPLRMSIL